MLILGCCKCCLVGSCSSIGLIKTFSVIECVIFYLISASGIHDLLHPEMNELDPDLDPGPGLGPGLGQDLCLDPYLHQEPVEG